VSVSRTVEAFALVRSIGTENVAVKVSGRLIPALGRRSKRAFNRLWSFVVNGLVTEIVRVRFQERSTA
jgi:hypothetical protein